MAEELKHLIEQIHKEGVEKANEQSETIISQAKDKASKIVAEAEKQANDKLLKAKTESDAFTERSIHTLKQAARDLLITVGQGCEKVVTSVLGQEVNSAVSADLLHKMITEVVAQGKGDAVLTVSESDKTALISFCADLSKKTGQEIELESEAEILSGFKIGFKNENVYLDYTGEAVADALANFLRPELAKAVSALAREQLTNA